MPPTSAGSSTGTSNPRTSCSTRREHAYLADFGLSRYLGEAGAALGAENSLGTIDYVAPEQIRGEGIDGRADVYALGCLLYECLAGKPPFRRASDAATLFAHLEDEPPSLPTLDRVLPRALAKEPSGRYQTCAELVGAAREALGIAEPRRSRWPVAFAAVGLAVIGATLLAFFLTRGDGAASAAQGGRLVRIDPSSNRVTASFPVGDGPQGVSVGRGRVWVASYRDSTLWQLDPKSGEGPTRFPAVGRPYAVAIGDGAVYVAASGPSQFTGNVSKFDAVTGDRAGGKEMIACSLASGTYGVWVAGCPNVQKLTADANPRFSATVVIPFAEPASAANQRESLGAMAQGEEALWVIGDAADRRLWRIDPRRHRITATIALGFPPGGVAVGNGAVWVTDELGDRVVRIDPATNRASAAIPVGRGALGVTTGAGSVWVADAIDHAVTRIDPATNRVTATIRVPAGPAAVAVGEGSIWAVGDARQ